MPATIHAQGSTSAVQPKQSFTSPLSSEMLTIPSTTIPDVTASSKEGVSHVPVLPLEFSDALKTLLLLLPIAGSHAALYLHNLHQIHHPAVNMRAT
jgi:hypothetical protein